MRDARLAWFASAVVYALSVWFVKYGLGSPDAGGDVAVYAADANAVAHGAVPYRDLYFEYPPGALVPVLAAQPFAPYAQAFKWVTAGCGAALLVVAAHTLRVLALSPWRLLVVAAAPFAVG